MSSSQYTPTPEDKQDDILTQVMRLEVMARELEHKRDAIMDALREQYDNGDIADLWTVYWHYNNIISVKALSKVLGIPASRMSDAVGPIDFDYECGVCETEFSVTVNSLNHERQVTAPIECLDENLVPFTVDGPLCPECDATQHARRKQRRDAWNRDHVLATEARRAELEALRTIPYRDYLQTEHWQRKRKGALRRANYKCQLCGTGGSLQVHHRSYENRGDEHAEDLIVLCEKCHAHFHANLKVEGAR